MERENQWPYFYCSTVLLQHFLFFFSYGEFFQCRVASGPGYMVSVHASRPFKHFWTVQIYLGNFLVQNNQNTLSNPNKFEPFKSRWNDQDACTDTRDCAHPALINSAHAHAPPTYMYLLLLYQFHHNIFLPLPRPLSLSLT